MAQQFFPCPKCGSKSRIISGNNSCKDNSVHRYKKCLECDTKFRTYEIGFSNYKQIQKLRKIEKMFK